MTFIGAGIGYRSVHRAALLAEKGPAVLEIMPDHFFGDTEALEALAERYAVVFHDVGLSVATVGDRTLFNARLDRIKDLARRAKPALFSDHLALTRSPAGIDLGHLAPAWLTEGQLDWVAEQVSAVQDVLGLPVAIENIAAPFDIPGGMPEPEFFERLVERTGCGMLLDVTNLLLTARNLGFDARARAVAYPLEAVRQVHLAGGFRDRHDVWVDSHSEPVEDDSYVLLSELERARRSLVTIVIERDDKLGNLAEMVAEAERASRIWQGMS